MVEKRRRLQVLISEINEDDAMAGSLQTSSMESAIIDDVINNIVSIYSVEKVELKWQHIPRSADEMSGVLAGVSPLSNDQTLYQKLAARRELGTFQAAIGSCYAPSVEFIVEDENSFQPSSDNGFDDQDGQQFLDGLFKSISNNCWSSCSSKPSPLEGWEESSSSTMNSPPGA